MSVVYVKGEYVAAENARISIDERGFRFGDGVFETMRIANGTTKHLARHLTRLELGLSALHIPSPSESLHDIAQQLIDKNATADGVLRISVSRGIGSRGYMPSLPDAPPTLVAEILPMPALTDEPLTLWLSQWQKPSSNALPIEAKLMQGVNSTLARLEAQRNDCDESLMLNDKGAICEASSANIFWRSGGLIYTPDSACGLVKGIAREILLERWQVQSAAFDVENLKHANSVMLCNSIRGAMAVFSLHPVGWQWMDGSLANEANEILNAA